ncbi:FMN-binding negative transcriptional regulator [Algibacter amylolyticus]|uniref:FMN-binding negative transcriptional regulator n=1 Tax=Algibacter amylolyticus TaxID=1608400 RepID=A0A5M7BFN0_9FLAO|nr:FMN-binding negative transcriptional regulator [Algibacter amylolyticus]KAA5828129.1 FMN-binding negative transcriptional regulator [Algibacter amylolyticus]MBB5267378.1 transcriptional regulator [Algibacter amylolyticus]TSJ82374.1 FMN-binding negative transcriptional regulator [Algibacter amylolyticus]
MSYPPKHHQDNTITHLIEVIKTYPLATLISVKDNVPYITHLPLIYNESGKLIGHIDINNPQAELLKNNNDITIIFSGPQCYISPSIYSTKQLPTWNYIKVHLKGKVKAIESKDALKQSLITMTEFLEAPDHKYVLEPDNKSMNTYLNYIEMFEISIDSWEGKFKLSQDKKPEDIDNAKAELVRANKESVEAFLEKCFN